MNDAAANNKESRLRLWITVIRPFAFTATIVPVLLGAAMAVYLQTPTQWPLLGLVMAAALLLHTGTNLVTEYFDFVKGVDRPETFGGSGVLVAGKMPPKTVLAGGLLAFMLTAGLGLYFIWLRGWPILVIGMIGMAGGFFYSALPVGYKYRGMGEIAVFILMGPLMVIGSYFVLTEDYHHAVLLVSLPVGSLTAAIMNSNNLRDIANDAKAGVRSISGIVGHRRGRMLYAGLVAGPFLIVPLLWLLEAAPLWAFATWASVPLAAQLIRTAGKSRPDRPEKIATLDKQTAQLHLLFGILLIAGIIAGVYL